MEHHEYEHPQLRLTRATKVLEVVVGMEKRLTDGDDAYMPVVGLTICVSSSELERLPHEHLQVSLSADTMDGINLARAELTKIATGLPDAD